MSKQYTGGLITKTPVVPTSLSAPGVWSLSDQAEAQATNTWPFPRDPQFNYVTMLLHGDGSAGAVAMGAGAGTSSTVTAFNTDASTNNFNVAINGDARSNNFTPYWGNGYYSNYFDGTGDYLTIAGTSTACALPGDFTIECFYFQLATVNYGSIFSTTTTYSTANSLRISTGNNTNTFEVASSGGAIISASNAFTPNSWIHIALVRSGTTLTLYQNGVSVGSATNSTSFVSDTFIIGDVQGAGAPYALNGYISNFRVVKGTAVYTAAFTPPTSPLTAITNTSLLTCQSNRFIDNSTNAFTITVNGNTAVFPAIPFTLPSGLTTYGSGYFDGTGDKLVTPASSTFNFGTGDFTIEMWVYPNATIPTYGNAFFLMDSRTNASWGVFLSSGKLYFANSSGTENNGGTIASFTWSHVAVSRASGTTRGFINGVQAFSFSDSGNYTGSPSLTIGGRYVTSGTTDLNGYLSNARIINGTGLYTTTFTPPTSPLTAITNTSLLTTQYNGGGNNSGFKDSSQNNFVITRNGNTTQGTFVPFGADWSNYFDGSCFNTPTSSAFNLSSGDWTMEGWFNLSAFTSDNRLFVVYQNASTQFGFYVRAGTIYVGYFGIAEDSLGTISLNEWTHLALVKSGSSTITLYVNGISTGSTTSYTLYNANCSFYIAGSDANYSLKSTKGYISNVRVVKGTAVYTGNFTPSKTPLTAISGTSLLTCQSNRFVDNSVNAFTLTNQGSPSVQGFSPFAPLTVYNPATYGGSAYFDGSGDYLTFSPGSTFAFGTGDFTVEFWVNTGGNSSVGGVLDATSNGSYWAFRINGTTFFYQSASGITNLTSVTVSTLDQSAWTHMAVVRLSGTTKIYANGVQVASVADSTNYTATTTYQTGRDSDGNQYRGYFSNIRVIKGTAVYTAAFTPPTEPLTAISGTSLLLSNSNAAILDNAMMNNLETVGNAQTSTSVVKYGTASMYFDGTGDYLAGPASLTGVFGTGNFTIEAWVYTTASSGTQCVFDTRFSDSSTAGCFFGLYSSNALLFYTSATVLTGGTLATNTWYHIAAVRSGTTVTLYLNGTSVASGTRSNDFTQNYVQVGGSPFVTGSTPNSFFGYIDDLRVTKYARYTATFTVPDQAFPNG